MITAVAINMMELKIPRLSPIPVKSAHAKAAAPRTSTDWVAIAEKLLRAGYVALLVLAVLVPSDTPADRGAFVAQAIGWMTLALGVSLWLVFRRRGMTWEMVDTLAVAYLGWTAVATLAVWGVGNLRGAVNSLFQTAAFVLVLLVGRQLLRTPEQRRILLTLALALASAVALLGVLQFLIFDPLNRAALMAHPEQLFEVANIADPNSPQAQRALARALSPEPLGTFTLTNSLACFLLPWMIVLLAGMWGMAGGWGPGKGDRGKEPCESPPPLSSSRSPVPDPRSPFALISGLTALLLFGSCLLVTHSRTSTLALLLGVALLIGARLGLGRMVRWNWWLGGIAAAAIIALAVVLVGPDSGLLSRAAASAQYRLEYWQSTWAMIVDHWLLGVGPGNFKSVYLHYKLPQASEEIGDPHNFILEVWATAGLPGMLLLGAMLVAVFWKREVRGQGSGVRNQESGVRGPGNRDRGRRKERKLLVILLSPVPFPRSPSGP